MSVDAVLIAGPTASGKSAAALELAQRCNGVVINTDSMQVYRELRILTARPSRDEEAQAPHALYGHVPVTVRYSAGRYAQDAAAVLSRARARGQVAIFVGGTGLYFHALEQGLSPIPTVPADTRARIRERFDRMGRDAFFAELVRRDPSASELRISDTQRILRAADVLEATGRPLGDWQALRGRPVLAGLSVMRFVIAPRKDVLFPKIGVRFRRMVKEGALEEAQALADLDLGLPAARALGLRELVRHLKGELDLEEAVMAAEKATHHYVKRQLTWFRARMSAWTWKMDGNFITQVCQEVS